MKQKYCGKGGGDKYAKNNNKITLYNKIIL